MRTSSSVARAAGAPSCTLICQRTNRAVLSPSLGQHRWWPGLKRPRMAGLQLSTEGTTNSQPNTLTDSASLSSSTSRTRECACSECARLWVYLHRGDIIVGLAGEAVSGILGGQLNTGHSWTLQHRPPAVLSETG